MSLTPLTITGVSQYSSDLQTILNRAVQIAQIPITQLQNRDADLLQEKTLLASLNASAGDLASKLSSLGQLAAQQAIVGTSSKPTVVSVIGTSATVPGSFTIDSVTSLAMAASERSLNSYADSASTPVSSTGTLKLSVGGSDYTFTLANNTLIALRDKINSLGAGVTASILTTSGGNYLSVTALNTGQTNLSLTDDPSGAATPLLTSTNQGSDAQFQLNGITVTQKSNLVNSVIPGVSFQLTGTSETATTINLQTDRSSLSSALQSFVTSYNSMRSSLNAQIGQNAGLLSGSPIVGELLAKLREIAGFHTSTGAVRSLADLGVTFDNRGNASFDAAMFNNLSDASITDAFRFIGSASSNLGGFSKDLEQFSDPATGLIKAEQDGIDRTDRFLQDQISTLTSRVNSMQTALSQRLQAADSLLAQLEAQQKSVDASLQGLSLVLYGKNQNQ